MLVGRNDICLLTQPLLAEHQQDKCLYDRVQGMNAMSLYTAAACSVNVRLESIYTLVYLLALMTAARSCLFTANYFPILRQSKDGKASKGSFPKQGEKAMPRTVKLAHLVGLHHEEHLTQGARTFAQDLVWRHGDDGGQGEDEGVDVGHV